MRWLGITKKAGLFGRFGLSVLMVVGLAAIVSAQEPPPDAKMRLTKIEFEGLQKQTRDKLLTVVQLQISQTVDMEAVKAAAQRLTQTGLFEKVAYRYRFNSAIIELTFELEEKTTGKRACVFDNFVWFTDQELKEAIRRDLPDFDGTMVVSDYVGEEIKKSLTRLLGEKKISGEVGYDLNTSMAYVFKVKGVNLKLCEAQFVGARIELLKPLTNALSQLLRADYSSTETRLYIGAALLPVYRERGYLKAAFGRHQAALSADGACANQVVITLPVEEGLQYRWDKVAWAGNQAFTAQQLDRGLKLKSGDVASQMLIDAGWSAVDRIYGGRGYITMQLKPERTFDDARQLVSYQVAVAEGPQYKMGEVKFEGVSEAEAQKLIEAWQLKPGEIFDSEYAGVFLSTVRRQGLIRFKDASLDLKRDDEKLTANLVLKFER